MCEDSLCPLTLQSYLGMTLRLAKAAAFWQVPNQPQRVGRSDARGFQRELHKRVAEKR
jgi:hypothetical protein